MYSVTTLSPKHLFNIHSINLDYKTESFTFDYYLSYFCSHPTDNFIVQHTSSSTNLAYLIGKHETSDNIFHCHVTALSVSAECRRWGLANLLMRLLERNGVKREAFFIDLFVRASNSPAIMFYVGNGYKVYRDITDYYINPVENALDMRKQLKNSMSGNV